MALAQFEPSGPGVERPIRSIDRERLEKGSDASSQVQYLHLFHHLRKRTDAVKAVALLAEASQRSTQRLTQRLHADAHVGSSSHTRQAQTCDPVRTIGSSEAL